MGEAANRRKKTRYKFTLRFYGIITALIVIIAGFVMCRTVFFNITDIVFENTSPYTLEEITAASDIAVGDNLFSMNMSKRAENLENNLAYVGTAEFERKLPSTLVIRITAPTPKMNIQTNEGLFYMVSDLGKVLEMNMPQPCQGYPTVYGYEPTSVGICDTVDSASSEKKALIEQIFKSLEENGFTEVVSIDVSNVTEITVQYNPYQSIRLGTGDDIGFKLELARAIVDKRASPNEYGTINVKSTQHPTFIGSHGGAPQDSEAAADETPEDNPPEQDDE